VQGGISSARKAIADELLWSTVASSSATEGISSNTEEALCTEKVYIDDAKETLYPRTGPSSSPSSPVKEDGPSGKEGIELVEGPEVTGMSSMESWPSKGPHAADGGAREG
jgi:hypothetical protein